MAYKQLALSEAQWNEIPEGSKGVTAEGRFALIPVESGADLRQIVSLPTTVDIAWITEYGMHQKLSKSVRCF